MTKTSGQKNGTAGQMLAALEWKLTETAEELGEALLDLKRQEKGGLADFKDQMALLRDLILVFNQERARLDKLQRSEGGGQGGGTGDLDLASARATVERGLARLGTARDTGAVSG
jgi:hypothetical protein